MPDLSPSGLTYQRKGPDMSELVLLGLSGSKRKDAGNRKLIALFGGHQTDQKQEKGGNEKLIAIL